MQLIFSIRILIVFIEFTGQKDKWQMTNALEIYQNQKWNNWRQWEIQKKMKNMCKILQYKNERFTNHI